MNARTLVPKLLPLAVGLGLFAGLLIWLGGVEVFNEIGAAGWPLLWVCIFALPDQTAAAYGWRILFPPRQLPGPLKIFWASWMGSAINTLLPVAAVGGELAKARLITLWGAKGLDAAATIIVDKSVQAVAIFSWGLIGLILLASIAPGHAAFWGSLASAVALGAGVSIFIVLQIRGGIGAAARRVGRAGKFNKWAYLVKNAEDLDAAVREIYTRPSKFLISVGLRLFGRFTLVGEIMLAAWLMGTPIGLVEAMILKSLVSVVRGAAFAVPGGLGLQEGGYIAIGALIGISPPLALALSLATRIREIVPSIPVILAWQGIEARHLAKRLTDR